MPVKILPSTEQFMELIDKLTARGFQIIKPEIVIAEIERLGLVKPNRLGNKPWGLKLSSGQLLCQNTVRPETILKPGL